MAYFIILTTRATLFVAGKTDIASATDAAQALRPLADDASALPLAVGLIGSGVLAVPPLTGAAAYGVTEAFGWRSGLDHKLSRAPQFYAVIVAATLVGMAIDFLGINQITALVLSAVLNGLVAAPLLVLVMLVSNRHSGDGRADEWPASQRHRMDHRDRHGRRRDRPHRHDHLRVDLLLLALETAGRRRTNLRNPRASAAPHAAPTS